MSDSMKLASGWPHVLEVWHFDRSGGATNIGQRKKTLPCKIETVTSSLNSINEGKLSSGKNLCETEEVLRISLLPKDFCKKDINSGIQRQFRCMACACLMESTNALKGHLDSAKHKERFTVFKEMEVGAALSKEVEARDGVKGEADVTESGQLLLTDIGGN